MKAKWKNTPRENFVLSTFVQEHDLEEKLLQLNKILPFYPEEFYTSITDNFNNFIKYLELLLKKYQVNNNTRDVVNKKNNGRK